MAQQAGGVQFKNQTACLLEHPNEGENVLVLSQRPINPCLSEEPKCRRADRPQVRRASGQAMRARLYVPCRHARSAPQHPCIGCHPCRSSVWRAGREQGSGNGFRTTTHHFPGWVIRWGVFASLECGCHVLVRHNAPRRHPGLSRVDIQILKKECIISIKD